MRTAQNPELREIFESAYGRRVSDSTWYRTLRLFNKDFRATKANVAWLGSIKKCLPSCDLRLACVVESIKKIETFISLKSEAVSGEDLLTFFDSKNIKIHPNTLTNWFKPINGFRRKRLYSVSELKPIILAALVYKLRKDNNSNIDALTKI